MIQRHFAPRARLSPAWIQPTDRAARASQPAASRRSPRSLAMAFLPACYVLRPSHGAGEAAFRGPRVSRASDVAVSEGYRIELVAEGLSLPSGVTFDAQGTPCVVESGYSTGGVQATPRLLRLNADGTRSEIARGGDNGPWTGVAFHDGVFLVAEGGSASGGRILSVTAEGRVTPLVADLPSMGDHQTNGPAVGPDGRIYFGVGTATNSGVVGADDAAFGWLGKHPEFRDIPARDIHVSGQRFEIGDPRPGHSGRVATTAFQRFGEAAGPGALVRGALPCTGAVLSIAATGGDLQLVAWGLRNPFGLAFRADGTLLVTENGLDERGSRPVWGAPEALWAIERGRWYGWPDYTAGIPIDSDDFAPPSGPVPARLIEDELPPPPQPLARFACHSSADGLDVSRSDAFGHVGEAFIALFGDQVPATGKLLAPVGCKVVRVELDSGAVEDFAVNRGDVPGPASWSGMHGLERPIAVRFDPGGESLYVVDFGVLSQEGSQPVPRPGTGALWAIRRLASAQGGTASP